jgi:hypothetical protein
VTRDDVAPLGDSEMFPCPLCGGGGALLSGQARLLCPSCGGSGYGPPPPSLDREMAHCLRRLSDWAHRAPQKEN